MPRFLNARWTTEATSVSHPARIEGRPSRMVTLVPMSASMDANSHPMAPPPMTAAVAGSFFRSKNSSEVTTNLPSTSKPGKVRGTEPAARMTCVPWATTPASAPSTTLTLRSASSRPVPSKMVTLRPLSSPLTPLCRRSTTSFLRAWETEKSTSTPVAVMPKAPACSSVRRTCAVSRNSLAGTHPRCRQVPPTLSRSTSAMLSPAAAP